MHREVFPLVFVFEVNHVTSTSGVLALFLNCYCKLRIKSLFDDVFAPCLTTSGSGLFQKQLRKNLFMSLLKTILLVVFVLTIKTLVSVKQGYRANFNFVVHWLANKNKKYFC